MWIPGQRTLPTEGEQALGLQFLFEFLERDLERADALQLNRQNTQLVLPPSFVDGEVSLEYDLLAVLQDLPVGHGLSAKQHTLQLSVAILDREVDVARALQAQVGDLARDPDLTQFLLQHLPHLGGQLGDGENSPCRSWIKQLAEVPLRF